MEDGGVISRDAIEEVRDQKGAGRLMKMPYPPKAVDASPRACRDGTRVAQLLRQAKEWRSVREVHEGGVSRYEFKNGEVLVITRVGDILTFDYEGPASEPPPPPETRAERDTRIAEMAAAGHSAGQIAAAVGVSEDHVRNRTSEMGIDLRKGIATTRRVDPNRIVEEAASTLDGLVSALALVDMSGLDQTRAGAWASSIRDSMKGITRFLREMEPCL